MILHVYGNGSACYIKLGTLLEGLKDAEKCIELNLILRSQRGTPYILKGVIQFLMKEYNKASGDIRRRTQIQHTNQELLYGVKRYT